MVDGCRKGSGVLYIVAGETVPLRARVLFYLKKIIPRPSPPKKHPTWYLEKNVYPLFVVIVPPILPSNPVYSGFPSSGVLSALRFSLRWWMRCIPLSRLLLSQRFRMIITPNGCRICLMESGWSWACCRQQRLGFCMTSKKRSNWRCMMKSRRRKGF